MANKYTLPIASKDTLGGVKIGQYISRQEDGTINVDLQETVKEIQDSLNSIERGKSLIASAITNKGIETKATATFQEMANSIDSITFGSVNNMHLTDLSDNSNLDKKRVRWYERGANGNIIHDEDVDIYTSADAVTCADGQTVQDKLDKVVAKNKDLIDHTTNKENPHNVTPEQLGVYTTDQIDETISHLTTKNNTRLSSNADFAEIAMWQDENPNNENRLGYFVCVDKTSSGITMRKATSIDDVRGATIQYPAFAANGSKDKFDSNGELLPQYNYVAFAGFATVIDNGLCTVNSRCMCSDYGTAIPSVNSMGYQVIERIDERRVLILVEPNADMLVRIKSNITDIEHNIKQIKNECGYVVDEDTRHKWRWGKDSGGIYLFDTEEIEPEEEVDVVINTSTDPKDDTGFYLDKGSGNENILNIVTDDSKLQNEFKNFKIEINN